MESGKYKRWTNAVYFPHSALRSSAGRFSHFPQKGREIEQTNRSSRERDEFHQAVPSATVSNVCHLQFPDHPLVSNYCYWNILIHFSCLLGKNVHLLQCTLFKSIKHKIYAIPFQSRIPSKIPNIPFQLRSNQTQTPATTRTLIEPKSHGTRVTSYTTNCLRETTWQ